MEGTWIEVRVITKSEALEPISGIFYGLDCKGVAIEDPNDILGREQGPLTWDFADINILEHKGKVAVVKGYFSEEDNIDDVIAYVKERVEELKESGLDVGEGTVEAEKMFEEEIEDSILDDYERGRRDPNCDGLLGDAFYKYQDALRNEIEDLRNDIYKSLLSSSRKNNTKADIARRLKNIIDNLDNLI